MAPASPPWRLLPLLHGLVVSVGAQSTPPPSAPPPPSTVTIDPVNILQTSHYGWQKYACATCVNYTGDMGPVTGQITMLATPSIDAGTSFMYVLHGVDRLCVNGPGSAPNSCGIHIHVATSCSVAAGGHYYNTQIVQDDPWTSVTYTAHAPPSGNVYSAYDGVLVHLGATQNELRGRVMILHDYWGFKAGCAVLSPTPSYNPPSSLFANDFVPYLGYTGTLRVKGLVGPFYTSYKVWDVPNQTVYLPSRTVPQQQFITTQLSGVDPRCKNGPGAAANSCGIHIHQGTSCITAPAGGHLYAPELTPIDPWTNVTYTSMQAEEGVGDMLTYDGGMLIEDSDPMVTWAALPVEYTVPTGFDASIIEGKVVIVHDFDGSRIACSQILIGDPFASYGSYDDSGNPEDVIEKEAVISIIGAVFLLFCVLGIMVSRTNQAATDPNLLSGAMPAPEEGVEMGVAPAYSDAIRARNSGRAAYVAEASSI